MARPALSATHLHVLFLRTCSHCCFQPSPSSISFLYVRVCVGIDLPPLSPRAPPRVPTLSPPLYPPQIDVFLWRLALSPRQGSKALNGGTMHNKSCLEFPIHPSWLLAGSRRAHAPEFMHTCACNSCASCQQC